MSQLMQLGSVLLAVLFGILLANIDHKIQQKNKKKQRE